MTLLLWWDVMSTRKTNKFDHVSGPGGDTSKQKTVWARLENVVLVLNFKWSSGQSYLLESFWCDPGLGWFTTPTPRTPALPALLLPIHRHSLTEESLSKFVKKTWATILLSILLSVCNCHSHQWFAKPMCLWALATQKTSMYIGVNDNMHSWYKT